jgi:hypothetical protein
MSDYDYLDNYENQFDKNVQSEKKIFDHPLANDPLTLIEDSVTPPEPFFVNPDPAPQHDSWDPAPPPPINVDPAVNHRGHPPIPGPDLPDPLLPGQNRFWRELSPFRPLGKSGTMTPTRITYRRIYERTMRPSQDSSPQCPKDGEDIKKGECDTCAHQEKDSLHGCKLLDEQADRLAGKKK